MNEFNFALCKKINSDKEFWVLKIKTIDQLNSFINVRKKTIELEYERYLARPKDLKYHFASDEQVVIDQFFSIDGFSKNYSMNQDKPKSADLFIVKHKMTYPYIDMFIKGKTLLVNHDYGFSFLNKNIEIIKEEKRKHLMFPTRLYSEKNIRIIKWPNGKHFYVKIGNYDVVIDGEQKWNTRKKAEEMGIRFLNEINKGEQHGH